MIKIPASLYALARHRASRLSTKLLQSFDPYNNNKKQHLKNIMTGILGEEIIRYLYEQASWQVRYGDGLKIDLIAERNGIVRYNEIKTVSSLYSTLSIPLYRHIKVDKKAWYVWVYIHDGYYSVLGSLPWRVVDKMPVHIAVEDNGIKKIVVHTYMLYQFTY
ncbi:MAG: hypothetical protein NZ888_06310 [Candidatus Nitrosocaldus sp.]|nr:hypothetical protein [Candidatus Nitrosocaldus sp.]MCS7141780.1 hypothetical protein [Candidatus Nitrosocaldus sp.]MDW8000456.1 hypothetical protein [Candidatus Nitrosocaldus sp.]